MNNRYHLNGRWIIWSSFTIAIILEMIPWPPQLYFFKPTWLMLIIIYWVMIFPYRVNIGHSFLLGLIMDLINSSTFGIRALSLSIIVYLVIWKFPLLKIMPIWQQILIIILLSIINKMIIGIIYLILSHTTYQLKIFYNSIIDGLLWPWFSLNMEKIKKFF